MCSQAVSARWYETNRYLTSVLDIRNCYWMIEDDLAARNQDDWTASIKRNFLSDWQQLGKEPEIIRMLEDTDGDWKADKSSGFASGFNSILDGIASGMIPNLGDQGAQRQRMPSASHPPRGVSGESPKTAPESGAPPERAALRAAFLLCDRINRISCSSPDYLCVPPPTQNCTSKVRATVLHAASLRFW